MENSTLADGQTLNRLKHQMMDVVRVVDGLTKVYPVSQEAAQVKHAVSVLVSELGVHGLLPADVHISHDSVTCGDVPFLLDRTLGRLKGRYRVLLKGQMQIATKRARADVLLCLLVRELLEGLPEGQKEMVEEMLGLHESLWLSEERL